MNTPDFNTREIKNRTFWSTGLLFSLGMAWAVLKSYLPFDFPYMDMIALLLLAVVSVAIPGKWVQLRQNNYIFLTGTILAVAASIYFRVRYLNTVPLGYNDEALNFVFFAQRLVKEGFPYIPYSWYAHTLFSYFIAVVMLFVKSPLLAQRLASAIISSFTLLFFFLCLKRNMGRHAAWIGLFLLGSSTWLAWATRNGYHQQLVPLFQLAFMYFFFEGLARKGFRWFMSAGIVLVFGLHAHYGYYLMLIIFAVFIVYLALFHRSILKMAYKPMIAAALFTVILLVPLVLFYYHNHSFLSYLSNVSPVSESSSIVLRLKNNCREMTEGLVNSNENRSLADLFIGVTALSGLFISIRRFRSDPFQAYLLIMTVIFSLGLFATLTNPFYIIVLIPSVFGFSSNALSIVLDGFFRFKFRGIHLLAFLGMTGLLTYSFQMNENKFFTIFRDQRFVNAYGQPGNAFMILDDVRVNLQEYEIYLPFCERDRDFEIIPAKLREKLDEFKFLYQTKPFDTRTIMFPASRIDPAKKGIRIYLANNEYLNEDMLKRYQVLYPNAQHILMEMPPPYPPRQMVTILQIPVSDLSEYWGYQKNTDPVSITTIRVVNLLHIDQDGFYQFRFRNGPGGELVINGKPAILESQSGDEESRIFLEKGIHEIDLPGDKCSPEDLEYKEFAKSWQNAYPDILHVSNPDVFHLVEPYLGSTGMSMRPYQRITRIDSIHQVRKLIVDQDGTIAALNPDSMIFLRPDGSIVGKVPLPSTQTHFPARLMDQWIIVSAQGEIKALENGTWTAIDHFPGAVRSVDSDGRILIALAGNHTVYKLENGIVTTTELQTASLLSDARFEDIAIAPDGYYAVEFASSALYRYGENGQIQRVRKLAHMHLPNMSQVRSDIDGNAYVPSWCHGISVYSPDFRLFYNSVVGERCLFPRCHGDANHLDSMCFNGKFPIVRQTDSQILVFQR